MSILQLKAQAAEGFSPGAFFGEIVGPLLGTDPATTAGGGTLVVRLRDGDETHDAGTVASWTIDFDDAEVYEGGADAPDCTLEATPAVFSELVRGKLDTSAAIEKRSLMLFGDPDVLERFANLLEGAGRLA
jgi:hypothetical protein